MIRRSVRRAVGGGLCLPLFFLTGDGIFGASAWADDADTQVTVIRPTGGDEALAEIATRAWAELNAGGVPARLIDCGDDADVCATPPAPPGGRVITLTTFRRSDETITEATLRPDGHARPTIRRSLTVSDEEAADPKVMAIRAVELVNAMLLQLDAEVAAWRLVAIADSEYPGQHLMPEPPVIDQLLSPGFGEDGRWKVGAGGSFLKGTGGASGALGFAVRVSYRVNHRFGVSAFLAEAPSHTDTTGDGSVSMNQQLAALEVTYRLYQTARVSSHLAFGSGGYRLNASWTDIPGGMPVAPIYASDTLWSLLFSAGGGGALALGREMSLFIEARAVLGAPTQIVYGPDQRIRRAADPSLLLSLGLQRAF